MNGGSAEREKASTAYAPWLGTLRKMRLICPFAVSPAKYGARQELWASCFCWFLAEQHRAGLASDPGKQILAACGDPTAYTDCPLHKAIREVK